MQNKICFGTSWKCLLLVGDCLEQLDGIPAGCVGLTISDPPYESLDRQRATGTTTRLKESKASSNPWFASFPNTGYFALFEELHRVQALNTHCYVFCDSETEHVILSGRNPYCEKLDRSLGNYGAQHYAGAPRAPKGPWTAWPTLTWLKSKCDDADPEELEDGNISTGMGYHWRRTGERILFLEKGKRLLKNRSWKDTLVGPRSGRKDFPTRKPQSVLRKLIENSCPEGSIVLDPFAGSGAVAEAALALGRRCILIEKYPSQWLKETLNGLTDVEVQGEFAA